MPRWEPDARLRLVSAALHLFAEQGYDETTVAQIAERAGLTRSTFFRHFPDKREVLAAGQETMSRLFADGVTAAPADATPLDAVAAGLARVAGSMTELNRELGPLVEAAVATSAELQERAQLKQVGIAAAVADALRARGVDEAVAVLAAELGAIAFKESFAEWIAGAETASMVDLALAALDRLRLASAQLG